MEKFTPRLFSPTQYAINTNERIGNTTVRAAIGRNHHYLFNYFFEPLLESDEYTNLLENIRAVTSNPELQGKLISTWEHEVYKCYEGIEGLDEEINILFDHVRHACLYLELAKAAEDNKDRDRAWAFTNEASLMINGISGASGAIFDKIDTANRTKQNRENGKGRIKNFFPVKQEAARLLEELKPKGGWLSVTSAASALEVPLGSFIDANRIGGIQSSNIQALLEKTWIPKDEFVNDAWQKSKRPKKEKSNS